MTDVEKIEIINNVLRNMHNIFRSAHNRHISMNDYLRLKKRYKNGRISPEIWTHYGLEKYTADSRISHTRESFVELGYADEYIHHHNIVDPILNFGFHLSAQDIIDMQIPASVAACTGHAKLFSKLAMDAGLDVVVIATANLPKRKNLIDGHQIIGVEIGGKIVAFDPANPTFTPIDGDVKIGNKIQSVDAPNYPKYTITAVVSPIDFAKVASYQDIENLYLTPAIKFKNATKKIKDKNTSRSEIILLNTKEKDI